MKENNKIFGLDLIRVLSMFFVIFLHCSSNRLRVGMESFGWGIANFITSFSTCGVPLFFMISGALILNSKKTYDISYVLKNRVIRLIIPLVFWSFIALLVKFYVDSKLVFSIENYYNEFIQILNKPIAVHFWFMYYLIPIYLISPAIKVFVDNAGEKMVLYIIFLWIIQILSYSFSGIIKEPSQAAFLSIAFIKNIGFLSGYLGYFILGFVLFNKDISINKGVCLFIAFFMAIFISIGTKAISEYNGFYTESFKSYKSIFVCLISIMIFIVLKDFKNSNKYFKALINILSPISYGVYLCHNIFLDVINYFGVRNYTILQVSLSFILVSFISIFTIFVFSRTKGLSFLFNGSKKL